MGLELNATYGQALDILKLVTPFSPDVRVIYDSSVAIYRLREATTKQLDILPQDQAFPELLAVAVPKGLALDMVDAFAVFGHVDDENTVIVSNIPYTTSPGRQLSFLANVGELLWNKANPTPFNLIKYGNNLVAFKDAAANISAAELRWSATDCTQKPKLG